MFGGPPVPKTDQPTEDREAVGSYVIAHDLAVVAERLFQTPGQYVDLEMQCPACGNQLVGRANKYTRIVTVSCSECTFTITR